ncbi:MAG TPA: tRNA (adenosine(37)-N6)-dimethylallyltransferase MiaA [Candidatus Solibacter sp.]|jgi:tRNA dimethylallyltransferase|nr:tRNA (adenosine(37)-N6)-dimethylallyltransferase MiaA [Candidatus Solibacter sp.]
MASVPVAIVGPTAVGKTRVAVDLCRRIGGEIVSIDSRQVYRGLEICSNAPSAKDLRGVRCHLVGVIEPGQKVDAAGYVAMARPVVESLAVESKTAVLTAGTGLYLKALLGGLDLGGHPADGVLRRSLETRARSDLGALVDELAEMEPDTASRIDRANPVRVVRALELATIRRGQALPTTLVGRPIVAVKIGLTAPRALLYEWIDARVDHMLTSGWLAEVRSLADSGTTLSRAALSSIGVRELVEVAAGRMAPDVARAAIAQRTRNYAKRQLTWFRADPEVRWLDMTRFSGSDIVEAIVELIEKR